MNNEITLQNNNNHQIHLPSSSRIGERGGKDQECNILNKLGHIVEYQSQESGKDMVNLQSELINPYGQNPFCIDLKQCTGIDDLCNKIKIYAETRTRLKSSTIKRCIRNLRAMSNHEKSIIPIDFLNPSYPQYIYHMNWYRNEKYDPKTHKNFYGLKQKKQAFELYLTACSINKKYFEYMLPSYPKDKPIEFPNPDIAFEITRHKYFKDEDENRLYQFIHLYNFIVGPRTESEDVVLTTDMIDWDNCSITYPQEKLGWELRRVFLPEAFMLGKTRNSLKNYVDHLLPKFQVQHSKDFLFLSPKTGRPFTKDYLRKQLKKTACTIYPKFYPYMARHFCATGYLITKYIEKYPDPIMATKNFMCHNSRKNTERYTSLAEEYYKKYPYNWFKRLLKGKDNCRVKVAENRNNAKIPLFRSKTLREGGHSPERIQYFSTGEKQVETKSKNSCFGFLSNLLKSFFFFFSFLTKPPSDSEELAQRNLAGLNLVWLMKPRSVPEQTSRTLRHKFSSISNLYLNLVSVKET